MKKQIKRYIFVLVLLFGAMGYGQVIDGYKKYKITGNFSANVPSTTNGSTDATFKVVDIQTQTGVFLQTMPVMLYTPPPITAPTINIQEILSNPSSSEEDKAKAHEALAIQQIQEAQAAAAIAQLQTLFAWLDAQAEILEQTLAIAQAQALIGSLQQLSQSVENGGTFNVSAIINTTTTTTWYMDNDGDGWNLKDVRQSRATCPGPGWTSSTKGEDCDDNDSEIHSCMSMIIPWFLDNDTDGYFAIVQPGTSKPTSPGNWTSTMTNGPDCDDTNPTIGMCSAMPPLLTYYMDNDGDGYDNGTITSTTNLGAPYKTTTKGLDCNDNVFSADNSVCVAPCATTCLTGYNLVNCKCVIDPCLNKDLRHKEVADDVKNLINQRTQTAVDQNGYVSIVNSFEIQKIEDGYGDINLDRYSLEIKKLPDGYTPQVLFEEIRQNFSDFVTGGNMTGTAVDLMPYSPSDGITWNSSNPVGAAMDFDNIMDTSTVICTEYNRNEMNWTFTTVRSQDHMGHFVSGHRQFGIETNSDGSYSFYLRGADRLGQWIDYAANGFSTGQDYLFNNAADATWKNLMTALEKFIKAKTGAVVEPFDKNKEYAKRFEYNKDDCPN